MSAINVLLNEAMEGHRQGNIVVAEAGYRAILAREPENFDALHLLGMIVAQRDPTSGITLIKQALKRNPNMAEAHYNMGNILIRLERFDEAASHFQSAAQLQPHNVEAVANLGAAFFKFEKYDEAETYLRKALALDPNHYGALLNLGAVMEMTDRFDETLSYYERARALQPMNPLFHHQLAGALLIRGHLAEGFREYAWRERLENKHGFFGRFAFPYWKGEPLAGRKILIWTEQGVGDEVLVASMINDVIAAGAEVVLLCTPRVEPLFRRAFPEASIIPAGSAPKDKSVLARMDFQASMSDLGQHLRPSLDVFRPRSYLKPDQAAAKALRAKYRALSPANLLVGISWHSANTLAGTEKSIPLDQWDAILQTPGVTFVNLQYGDHRNDADAAAHKFGARIVTDTDVDPLGNLDTFAAQVAAMDLSISVSSTTVHLAGAMGRPVWALIPSNRGRLWYWFLEREDSPWYPQARLFRRPADGNWKDATNRVAAALKQAVSAN